MNKSLSHINNEKNLMVWMLPLTVLCIGVFVIPIFQIIRLSFTESTLIQTAEGFSLNSYVSLFTNRDFLSIMGVTLIFVCFSVLLQVVIGFAIALYLDYGAKHGYRGMTIIVRMAVLAAWAIPGVVIGVMWKMLFSEMDSGLIMAISRLVVPAARPRFLSSPVGAMISSIVANVWRGTAYSMIMLYAGLMTFPRELDEAAEIDGAHAGKRLFMIKLPVLAPLFMICILLVTIQTFNTFDMLMALTGGGPGRSTEVMALHIYHTIFTEFDLGRGSAAAVFLLLINVGITWIYFRFLKDKEA